MSNSTEKDTHNMKKQLTGVTQLSTTKKGFVLALTDKGEIWFSISVNHGWRRRCMDTDEDNPDFVPQFGEHD